MTHIVVDGIDMGWFMEARQLIDRATTKNDLPLMYHAAFDFLRALPGMGNVRLSPAQGGFVYTSSPNSGEGSIHLDGLTKQLSRVFHPALMDVGTGGARTGGSARGCRVDNELADIVNRGKMPDAGAISLYTLKTLRQLQAEGLQPFCAQVPVGCLELKLATALDLVCINTKIRAESAAGGPIQHNVVNAQIKTGFDQNYTVSRGAMHSPLTRCPSLSVMGDSHANRHVLQLIAEHLIVQRGYGNPLQDSVLIVISEKTHTVIPVCKELDLVKGVFTNLKKRDEKSELELEIAAVKRQHAVKKVMRRKARFSRSQPGGAKRAIHIQK